VIRLDITGDNGACRDDRALSDVHAWENDGTVADPSKVLDYDRATARRECLALWVVLKGPKSNLAGQVHVAADHDPLSAIQRRPQSDRAARSD
jgi:hypothetical protein